jgi:tetratricopeptide (TPR) repeat protein
VGGHPHPHARQRRPWGEPAPGAVHRLLDRLRALLGHRTAAPERGLRELPLVLRRAPLAEPYLAAERDGDHRRAAAAAVAAMEHAAAVEEWWQADLWAHRGLWHFERAQLTLQATRQARRIGDLRVAAGDPASARRYYAEAIDESRDIGAEHEQGRAALGLGKALLELGDVTQARKLASAAIDLLDRAAAPAAELAAARELLGTEVAVGEGADAAAEERH